MSTLTCKNILDSMSKVVLLVEDNEFIRNMYQLKLAKADLTVIEAVDGKMALERITAQKPDLVLLDLMMPNVGGLEVLRDLKKLGMLPELPVIVLTNVMDPQTIDQAKELGAKDYIVKTDLTPSQVIDKLKPFIK